MSRFRSWRALLLVCAMLTPVPVTPIVHYQSSVIVEREHTHIDAQLELASSTWTKREVKPQAHQA